MYFRHDQGNGRGDLVFQRRGFAFGFINDGAEVLLPLRNEFKGFGRILNDQSFNLGVFSCLAALEGATTEEKARRSV